MPIVFLALVAAAYAYAMVALPRFRVPGLALGALICLALALYVWRTDPEAAAARVRIAPSELTLDQLSLRQVGRGAALQGRVMNGSSAFRLREMTLTLRLRDCPAEDAEPASCPIIGESPPPPGPTRLQARSAASTPSSCSPTSRPSRASCAGTGRSPKPARPNSPAERMGSPAQTPRPRLQRKTLQG